MRSGEVSAREARTTCSIIARPPARCKTFACRERMRTPRPAARITTRISIAESTADGPSCRFSFSPPPLFRQVDGDRGEGPGVVADLLLDDAAVPAQQIGRKHPEAQL